MYQHARIKEKILLRFDHLPQNKKKTKFLKKDLLMHGVEIDVNESLIIIYSNLQIIVNVEIIMHTVTIIYLPANRTIVFFTIIMNMEKIILFFNKKNATNIIRQYCFIWTKCTILMFVEDSKYSIKTKFGFFLKFMFF